MLFAGLFRSMSSVLLLRMAGIVFQMGWFMLLVRLLPIEEVGLYSAINAAWVLMRALGPVGADQALMRKLPDYFRQHDDTMVRAWQSVALRFSLLHQLGLVMLACVIAMLGHTQEWWNMPASLLAISAISAICYGLNGVQVHVLLSAEKPLMANLAEMVLLPLALVILSALLVALDAVNLHTILTGQAAIALCICGIYLYLTQRITPLAQHKPIRLDESEQRAFRRQCYVFFGISGVIPINVRLPVILGPLIIGATHTALLETAVRFASMLGLLQIAASQVTVPRISSLCKQGQWKSLQQLLMLSCWMIFIPALVAFGVLVVLGEPLIAWVTRPEYVAAYAAMLILAFGYVIHVASGSTLYTITMSGHAKTILWISVMEACLTAVLVVAFGYAFGLVGMAVAMMVGMSLRNILLNVALVKILSLRPGVWSIRSVQHMLHIMRRIGRHE